MTSVRILHVSCGGDPRVADDRLPRPPTVGRGPASDMPRRHAGLPVVGRPRPHDPPTLPPTRDDRALFSDDFQVSLFILPLWLRTTTTN